MPAVRCPHSRAGYRSAQDLLFPSFSQATIISYSSLRGIVEQNVDIPVPLGRGRSRGGLGFHPGQSSTAFRGADHRSGTAEQIVDIPAPHGGQDLLLQRRLPVCRVRQIMGFLALFSPVKKVRRWGRTRVRGCPPVSAHPRRRLSWRVSSLLRTTMCGCGFLLDNGCCLARTRISSATSPVRACPRCSGWQVSVIKQLQFQQFVGQWRVLYSSSTEWWILPLCSETGTHSVTLCFLDWLLTCPLCMSRSSSTLSWRRGRFPWTTEILQLQSIDQVLDVPVAQVQVFSGAGREKLVEIPQLQPLILDTVVHLPVVCNDRCRMVQTPENCEGPAVAVLMKPWSMSLLCRSAGTVGRFFSDSLGFFLTP